MASHPRRHNHPSMFTSKTPHFFKVILQENAQDGILGIPRKFVTKYGNQLSSFVKLEVPSGVIWQVELTKSNGRVQLQNGWREFAEHYSVEVGSFVVFRYEGNGHFHVLIFDKTASEIEYPYSTTEDDHFCDEVSANRKSKEKRELPCPLPQKKIRTDSPNQPGRNSKYEVLSSDIKPSRINLGNLKKFETSLGQLDARRSVKTEAFSCVQMLTATEKTRALQIASAFESTGNPVFMVVMQPSFVCKKYRMGIPWNFARNFLPMHNCDLTLLNSAGITWLVNYYSNAKIKSPLAQLYGGWRAFVEDNNLTVGDICVFELIKRPKILMKVLIYPVVENASKACRPHLSRKSKGKSHIPCPLPRKKMRTDSPNIPGTNSKLEVSSSDISPDDSKSSRISLGNLKQVEKLPGQLHAQRSVKTEAFSCVQRLTAIEKAYAVQIASAFKSTENPVFMVVMQPSFVCYSYRMGMPWDFATNFLPKHNCDLTLLDSDGKTWPMKYYCSATHAQLYGGWQAFAENNHLYVRDICVFELFKRHPKILMKVVINPAVENASKVRRPQAHGSIASRVKTRSLVNDTEPNCQLSPCPSSSIKMEDSSVSYIEILDDIPLNQNAKKKSTSSSFQPCKVMRTNPSGSIEAKGIKLEKEKKSMDSQYLTKDLGDELGSPKDDSARISIGQRCLKPELTGKIKIEPFTPNEKQIACTSNPSFSVVIQPSSVLSCTSLHIRRNLPRDVCRKMEK